MDLKRRVAQGRLSEVFGSVTIETDKRMRTLDLYSYALDDVRNLPNTTMFALDAFIRVRQNSLF